MLDLFSSQSVSDTSDTSDADHCYKVRPFHSNSVGAWSQDMTKLL